MFGSFCVLGGGRDVWYSYFPSCLSSSFRCVVGETWYLVDYLPSCRQNREFEACFLPHITFPRLLCRSEHVTAAFPLWRVLDLSGLPRCKQKRRPPSAICHMPAHHQMITRISKYPSREPKEIRYGHSKHPKLLSLGAMRISDGWMH